MDWGGKLVDDPEPVLCAPERQQPHLTSPSTLSIARLAERGSIRPCRVCEADPIGRND